MGPPKLHFRTLPRKGIPASHERVPRSQHTRRPAYSCSLCSSDGGSELNSETEIWLSHYPLEGAGSMTCTVSTKTDFWLRKLKIDPSSGRHENGGEATNPMPFEYQLPRASIPLGSP